MEPLKESVIASLEMRTTSVEQQVERLSVIAATVSEDAIRLELWAVAARP